MASYIEDKQSYLIGKENILNFFKSSSNVEDCARRSDVDTRSESANGFSVFFFFFEKNKPGFL